MTSAHPAMASRASASHSVFVNPKAVIAAPQMMTATTTARPRRSSMPTRCREQITDDGRTTVKDAEPECWEQGSGHAEDHRVDVDEIGALHNRSLSQVPQALDNGSKTGPVCPGHWRDGSHHDRGHDRDEEAESIDPVDPGHPGMADEQPTQRWSGHPANLCERLEEGERSHQILGAYERRDHRVAGRVGESPQAGSDRADEVEGDQRGMGGERVESQAAAGQGESRAGHDQKQATIDRIADRAADQGASD
jgi:hypothetical protein